MSAPQTVYKLLKKGALQGLVSHSRALREAEATLRTVLPAVWHGKVTVANLDHGTLTLLVPDAAVGLRMRFLGAALLAAATQATQTPMRTLRICVGPVSRPPQRRPAVARRPDHQAVAAVRAAAQDAGDTPLRAALERLAATLQNEAPPPQAGTATDCR